LRPTADFSATARMVLLEESEMKNALSTTPP
jgi:hypothetical protein